MIKRNMGMLDRTLRIILGLAFIPAGLILLRGWWGNISGIIVSGLAFLVLIVPGISGFCPGYVPFGISTVGKKNIKNLHT